MREVAICHLLRLAFSEHHERDDSVNKKLEHSESYICDT